LWSHFLDARTTRGEDYFFNLKSLPLKVILAHSGTASLCPGDSLYADHFETQVTKTLAVLASAATTTAWLHKNFGQTSHQKVLERNPKNLPVPVKFH